MGSSVSKRLRPTKCEQEPCGPVAPNPQPDPQQWADGPREDGPTFLHPYQDPKAFDDDQPFPLDGQDISSASEQQLLEAWSTGLRIREYGGVKVVRISKSLVIKGGIGVAKSESENMTFALERLHLPVPKVHRSFKAGIPNAEYKECQFIVMDYIAGPTVETCWHLLDKESRESVATQVAKMMENMQSNCIANLPIGPIGHNTDEPFRGPWFTDYGAGPFTTLGKLETWCNSKIDVCIMFKQLPASAPRFQFKDAVFTHQDMVPRNMILDKDNKVTLIGWGYAGVYPRGFEQAVLREQSWDDEFVDMVLAKLPDKQEQLTKQYRDIAYALPTDRRL